MDVVLQLRNSGSEFGRVPLGFLFRGYLRYFSQVGITAKVKRIKAMGEVLG
jgi:hypothetical protein